MASGNACTVMVVHQLVETAELDNQEEELALGVSEDLKMMDSVLALDTEGELSLTRTTKAPSCLFIKSFSAPALVILP